MKKILSLIISCLYCIVLCHSQKIELNIQKDLSWSKWTYTSMEFNNDCTILNGYVTSEKDWYVNWSNKDYIEYGDKKYKRLDLTIPHGIKSNEFNYYYDVYSDKKNNVYIGGDTVYFSEKFEPLYEVDGDLTYTIWPNKYNIKDIHISKKLSNLDKKDNLKVFLDSIKKFKFGNDNSCQLRYVNQFINNLDCEDNINWKDSLLHYYNPIKTLMSKPTYSNTSGDELRLKTNYTKTILERLNIDSSYEKNLDNVYSICDLLDSVKVYKERKTNHKKFYSEGDKLLKCIDGGEYYKNCFEDDLNVVLTNALKLLNISSLDKNRKDYEYSLKLRIHFIAMSVYKQPENLDKEELRIATEYFEKKYGTSNYYYIVCLMLSARSDVSHGNFENAFSKFQYIEKQLNINKENLQKEQDEAKHFLTSLINYSTEAQYDILKLWENSNYYRSVCYFKKGDIEKARELSPNSPVFMLRPCDIDKLLKYCEIVNNHRKIQLNNSLNDKHLFDWDQRFTYSPYINEFPYYALKTNNDTIIRFTFEGWLNEYNYGLYNEKKIKHELKALNLLDSLLMLERENDYFFSKNIANKKAVDNVEKLRDFQKRIAQKIRNGEINGYSEWEDCGNLSKYLNSSSIGIMIHEVNLFASDTIMYVAMKIDDKNHIEIKALCEKTKLDSIGDCLTNYIDTLNYEKQIFLLEELYKNFWKPMEGWMKNKSNVYFSVGGSAESIPLEAAIINHKKSDKRHYHRLTSLRELSEKYPQLEKNFVLYGGIKYNNTYNDTSNITSHGVSVSNLKKGSLGDISSESRKEINGISQILKSSKISYDEFLDNRGTEKSVKLLSQSNVTNLHISTHGFYIGDSTESSKDRSFLRPQKSELSSYDVNLKKTGLLMSGSMNAYYKPSSYIDSEDGILTGKEISLLDFTNIDLVVLSACNTGIGDVMDKAGMYGLQRGFKKAGARSVLMTLWEVEAASTTLFMIEFYKNLIQRKKSKYDSLISAQKYLKNYKNESGKKEYSSPKFWAAFILLDATD